MKRMVALLAWLCLEIHCCGQGAVNFNNHPVVFRDTIDRRVYSDFVGGAGVIGTNFVAELWYGSDANNITSVAPRVAPFFAPGDPYPGIWRGGIRTLNGFDSGDIAILQVKVWDATLFSSYEEASLSPGAIFGASQPFSYMMPPVGTAEGLEMVNLRAFALIPEPSVVFTALLSLAAFMVFINRRRLCS